MSRALLKISIYSRVWTEAETCRLRLAHTSELCHLPLPTTEDIGSPCSRKKLIPYPHILTIGISTSGSLHLLEGFPKDSVVMKWRAQILMELLEA